MPGHADKDFPCVLNNDKYHYHTDWRFLSGTPRMSRAMQGDVTWEPHICYRSHHAWNPGFIFMVKQMYSKYRGERAICGKCPHKGIIIDGNQCPGHGLMFDDNGVVLDGLVEYRIGTQRVVGHDSGFKAIVEQDGIFDKVQLVIGDTVVAEHDLKQQVAFNAGDTFNFTEVCPEGVQRENNSNQRDGNPR